MSVPILQRVAEFTSHQAGHQITASRKPLRGGVRCFAGSRSGACADKRTPAHRETERRHQKQKDESQSKEQNFSSFFHASPDRWIRTPDIPRCEDVGRLSSTNLILVSRPVRLAAKFAVARRKTIVDSVLHWL